MIRPADKGTVQYADSCAVVLGMHKGKTGTVEDWKQTKTGHATITVRQADGDRFKTLARNARPSEGAT